MRSPVRPYPPSAQEIANPLRGQYEDLLDRCFRKPIRRRSGIRLARVVRRHHPGVVAAVTAHRSAHVAPDAPDDLKYDFSAIDNALTKLAGRNMRLTLRVVAYNSCCDTVFPNNTNIGIPDWMRSAAPTSTGPPTFVHTRGDAGRTELE